MTAFGLLAGLLLSGCVLLDDFGKFKVEKQGGAGAAGAGGRKNAGGSGGQFGPGADSGAPVDTGCKNVDCTALDGPCARGECRDGKCMAVPSHDGEACGKDKCTTCQDGACGPPKDCTSLTGACAQGVCNPNTGECEKSNVDDGTTCFDANPCTFGDRCQSGACVGQAYDCSAYDDECSQGVCDTMVGGCAFGPNRMSQPCSDANPCTLNDRCNSTGFCVSDMAAPEGATCTDYNVCSGTAGALDACDGTGRCLSGGDVPVNTTCDDDNECTTNDACDGIGSCVGNPTREGQVCNAGCSTNTTCQSGFCGAGSGSVPAYNKQCFLQWCGRASLCQTDWQHDRVCDCGCPFSDPDCNDCSMRMCESDSGRKHRATSWCNQAGKAIDNCPDTLKGDGKCDCGCQFVDPDCSGGSCCGATGKAGCGVSFVENCVCKHESNPEPTCCSQEWTQHCTDVGVALGCMVCP